jgi:hypothetical protein
VRCVKRRASRVLFRYEEFPQVASQFCSEPEISCWNRVLSGEMTKAGERSMVSSTAANLWAP